MTLSLQSISKTRRTIAPKIVLFGPGKIGKSTFAASAPAPIAIPTEDGLSNLDVDAFPLCTSLSEVYEAIGVLLTEAHEFKTVFLDSLDWLEPLLHAHVCAVNGWESIESAGYGKGYVAASEEWRQVLAGFDALRNERAMTVIIIAHEQIKRFESPMTESYDLYTLKLHQRASAVVQEWADVIGFAQYRTLTRKEDAGFNKKETKAMGTGERLLHLQAQPSFLAGNRFGMPAEIPLAWDAFANALLPVPF